MIRRLIAVTALLAPNTGAQAQETGTATYKLFDNGWRIMSESDQCVAMRYYDDGDILYINYQPKQNSTTVLITDADSTSLEDGQQIKLHPVFVGNGKVDDGWGAWNFTVSKGDRFISMFASFSARDMLADIAKNDTIAFSIDGTPDRLVGAYRLDGSAAAMATLRRCAFEVSGLNPDDPFLK